MCAGMSDKTAFTAKQKDWKTGGEEEERGMGNLVCDLTSCS